MGERDFTKSRLRYRALVLRLLAIEARFSMALFAIVLVSIAGCATLEIVRAFYQPVNPATFKKVHARQVICAGPFI
jgi:hypothetical protein